MKMFTGKYRWIAAPVAGVALLLSTASTCNGSGSSAATKEQKQQQAQHGQAFAQQEAAVPYPASQLKDSAERRNLRERLLRFNQTNRVGYVYIFNFGKVEGYYSIEGKVSSTNSQMTTPHIITQNQNDNGQTVVDAPGDDGSYDEAEQGVFFFTTEGALVETNQDYLYSDQPIATYASLPKLNTGSKQVTDLTTRQ